MNFSCQDIPVPQFSGTPCVRMYVYVSTCECAFVYGSFVCLRKKFLRKQNGTWLRTTDSPIWIWGFFLFVTFFFLDLLLPFILIHKKKPFFCLFIDVFCRLFFVCKNSLIGNFFVFIFGFLLPGYHFLAFGGWFVCLFMSVKLLFFDSPA